LRHNTDREELEVTIGQKRIHLNFNKAAAALAIGDRKTITVPPEDAFGRRRDELVFELEKKKLPKTASAAKGQAVRVRQADGNAFDASIAEIRDDSVILDANHPLAGKTLVFDIELVAVSYGR
jgi:FKBP-type peptidyl-prolyl cis-trans isomerase 2